MVERAESQLKAQEIVKRKELQAQVDKASFQSLSGDLASDLEEVEKYNRQLTVATSLWAQQVQSYKRNRRNKGLNRVTEFMSSRLHIIEVPNFEDVPKAYSQFKVAAAKEPGAARHVDSMCPCSIQASNMLSV